MVRRGEFAAVEAGTTDAVLFFWRDIVLSDELVHNNTSVMSQSVKNPAAEFK